GDAQGVDVRAGVPVDVDADIGGVVPDPLGVDELVVGLGVDAEQVPHPADGQGVLDGVVVRKRGEVAGFTAVGGLDRAGEAAVGVVESLERDARGPEPHGGDAGVVAPRPVEAEQAAHGVAGDGDEVGADVEVVGGPGDEAVDAFDAGVVAPGEGAAEVGGEDGDTGDVGDLDEA